ncbi:MAG: hypothetical protein EOS71_00400 [Mesorhizobium sp.]|nr:hypothetical protein EOA35_23655 [Mesorhizobium sp. M8A.F.Ca.ET.023.01.1.1]RWC77740.1 MAG: hypothetical protein EOS71_00400 [Mesorhizobium sp.]TIS99579.1 MAG: hypothetical protein E5W88_03270 [Mesorhizobium sp.]
MAPREFPDRSIYGFPGFYDWLGGPLLRATAFDPINIAPRHQAAALFRDFISGKPLNVGRTFKRMRPKEADVFELVTPDVRIFGWFPKKNVFVAVAGDLMENTHGHDLYPGYRDMVVHERNNLDLDEPKWLQGVGEDDVVSF